MAQLTDMPAPNNNAWHDYTTIVAVRTNPTLYGTVELVVQDAGGKRATIRVQGAVVQAN